ncbi:hypothetical protein PVAND_003370 [Polypedilum vanderplanki]|uniref:Uncharacterized protein n=1 Tax=Polypedilum vanderplanki TaxID=319348 RepID=A0A9J6BVL2_POLVA|nr:hypothetical protein PVAND_003370 [Polypedilum vanderplanki]
MEKYHRTYEIKFEGISLDECPIEGALVIYKSFKLLNIPIGIKSTHGFENFRVSKCLYIIQKDFQKISADRLARFLISERNEIMPKPLPDVSIKKRQSISLGNFSAR